MRRDEYRGLDDHTFVDTTPQSRPRTLSRAHAKSDNTHAPLSRPSRRTPLSLVHIQPPHRLRRGLYTHMWEWVLDSW